MCRVLTEVCSHSADAGIRFPTRKPDETLGLLQLQPVHRREYVGANYQTEHQLDGIPFGGIALRQKFIISVGI